MEFVLKDNKLLKLVFSKTNIGNRTKNLDEHGHISGENWSISYIIDGFYHSDYARDSSLNINDLFKPLDRNDMDQLLSLLDLSITKIENTTGKASAVFALCCDSFMHIISCGDTRAYLLSQKIRTRDHSQAQHLIDIGKFKENSPILHNTLKQLRRCLEKGSNINDLDTKEYKEVEDLILCSDGIWNKVSNDNEFYNVGSKEHANELFNVAKKISPLDNQTLLYLQSPRGLN